MSLVSQLVRKWHRVCNVFYRRAEASLLDEYEADVAVVPLAQAHRQVLLCPRIPEVVNIEAPDALFAMTNEHFCGDDDISESRISAFSGHRYAVSPKLQLNRKRHIEFTRLLSFKEPLKSS